ncbi:HU family DNA-binding protein [Arenibacterium sp. CAU 1754]
MATTSSTGKTTTSKTASKAKTTPKPTTTAASADPAVSMPDPKVVTTSAPVLAEADMKKKELVDLVVERSGMKKKDIKPAVEATLAVLGEAIANGRELNLQPFGKLRINRSEEKANGRVTVCKLRQSLNTPKAPQDPLAEAAE